MTGLPRIYQIISERCKFCLKKKKKHISVEIKEVVKILQKKKSELNLSKVKSILDVACNG